jgi:hypothetical protein
MRTKALLATAAVIASGVVTSMAQVYSANIVGYINLNLVTKYNLVTVQLSGPTNQVNPALANSTLADNSLLYQWDFTNKKYAQALTSFGGQWYDASFNLATNPVVLGQAFYIFNAGTAAATLTLVGDVPQGSITTSVVNGYGFYGDPVPVAQDISTNGFPIADNSLLYTWNPTTQKYNQALTGYSAATASAGGLGSTQGFFDANFSRVSVVPGVGLGFVYFNASTTNNTWVRNFTPQ